MIAAFIDADGEPAVRTIGRFSSSRQRVRTIWVPQRRLRYITLPLLKPTFVYVIITGLIGAFQLFDTSYVVFSSVENVGGPLDSALTPVLYLYYRGFGRFQLGYASAIAWVLFAVIAILSLVNLRVGRASEDD